MRAASTAIHTNRNFTPYGATLEHERPHRRLLVPLLVIAVAFPSIQGISGAHAVEAKSVSASDKRFRQWVERLWPAARRKGVKRSTFNAAFRGVLPDPEVTRSANYQPEFVRPVWDYISSAASETRITTGRKLLQEHEELLDALERNYKVDRHVIVAIWGMESNYGSNRGELGVIRSLATLAYHGRRKRFGRQQLLSALKILQRGDIPVDQMKGSWAGAMGHTQFIPTTYDAFAVDFDEDGRRDIWQSSTDALASTANYLHRSGWRFEQAWGYEVKLPKKFNSRHASLKRRRTIAGWRKLGLRRADGKDFPRKGDKASLYMPAGKSGPAFLVIRNFRAILRYNNAATYALGVGHLADRLRGAGPFRTPWPTKDKPLGREQRVELQKLLTAKGFDTGGTDGIIGTQTLQAVRKYQKARGRRPNTWPSVSLLEKLRGEDQS